MLATLHAAFSGFSPTHTTFTPTTDANMNGHYEISKTPGAPADKAFSTDFKDYPGGVEYFEVYHGPLTTTYGQVWWTSTANPLPDDIVRRFDGKAISWGSRSTRCARPRRATCPCRSTSRTTTTTTLPSWARPQGWWRSIATTLASSRPAASTSA